MPAPVLTAISWNMCHRPELWRTLPELGIDVALVQEACQPPADLRDRVEAGPGPWRTDGAGLVRNWRTAVARLDPGVDVRWHPARAICDATPGDLAVSRVGTLAAADVRHPGTGEMITFVSLYAPWESPHPSTESTWIYADASAHRLISDLSVFIGRQRGHRIVAAGDLNILRGYGENGSRYWAERYRTVFDRLDALGLRFVGPEAPNGRQAEPWPRELPRDSRNVPTFHTTHQSPETAARQLDFAFASVDLADRVRVAALNRPEDWGGSDHCMVRIEIGA